jgi:SAM-dependent methyltransferase
MSAIQSLHDPAYFERLARIESRHWWSLGMWRLADAWLDFAIAGRCGLRALDAGCGTGLCAARLARRPEIEVTVAVDPSRFALDHAHPHADRSLLRGSVLALPLAAASVDLVTCFDVLQHLPSGEDRVAAAEIHRVLRPGGWALVRTNGKGGWQDDAKSAAPYDPRSLSAVFAGAGFQVIRCTYANCLPAMAQEWRARLLRGGRAGNNGHPAGKGLAIELPPPWINGLMRLVSDAEAVAAGRWGWELPFGHSTMLLARKHPVDAEDLKSGSQDERHSAVSDIAQTPGARTRTNPSPLAGQGRVGGTGVEQSCTARAIRSPHVQACDFIDATRGATP